MTQLLLADSALFSGSKLDEALLLLESRLAAWASNTEAYNALLLQVFGVQTSAESNALLASISGSGLGISFQILDATTMGGLVAAYTSNAPAAGERIYLHATWLETATAEQIEAVLLEEIGHAIDYRLNGTTDSPGDEGEIFSALLRGETPDPAAYSENDQSFISIDGVAVSIEAAADTTAPTGSLFSTAPAYATASTNPFGISDVGSFASPALADADGDGDLDLFIGERFGNTLS